MTTKTKKIIAREFIYLIVTTILFLIVFFCCLYLFERNDKLSKEIKNKIEAIDDSLPKKQLLWIELSDIEFYTDSYKEFQTKYSSVENQKFLYQQLKNNNIYTKSLSDFRLKYFRKDLANEDIYELYRNEYGWVSEEKFNSLLKKPEVVNWLYKKFVETGYKHSFTDFKNLISGTEHKVLSNSELKREFEKRKKLEEDLEKKENSIFNGSFGDDEIFAIGLIVFSLLFLLRYLIYGIKWSINQLK